MHEIQILFYNIKMDGGIYSKENRKENDGHVHGVACWYF